MNEIKHLKFFTIQDDVVGDVREMLMWHSCMLREVLLVGHTNISIDDSKKTYLKINMFTM
jgi:hypothetical protein